ncbi:MAG: hypothetical protein C4539_12835 [Ignavibacteriales bacterium]|nr:MAG: hypothetical protein C4539_12835 [Ignavibacteriales bacterium]
MKFRLKLFIVVLFSTLSYSQFSSLDVDMDARSIAMGESFVANPNGIATADDNPATLIGNKGLTVNYNRRNLNPYFNNPGNKYYCTIGTSMETSVGNFGIFIKRVRDDYHSFIGAECVIYPKQFFNYTAILSYAKNIFQNFTVGVNLKTHSYKTELNNNPLNNTETNNPILFDIGVLYRANGFINSSDVKDKYNLGASLLNYGTDYKVKVHSIESSGQNYVITKLPRLLKLGFAYEIDVKSKTETELFGFVFTGEYDYLLNSYRPDSQKDFWGAGFEATVMDILSLRIGGTAYPFYNYYGFKGDFSLRYGAGINLPFSLIADNFPLHICFDYAVMITKDKDNSLDAFNVSINYENPFF